jgi:hypothetical protein
VSNGVTLWEPLLAAYPRISAGVAAGRLPRPGDAWPAPST